MEGDHLLSKNLVWEIQEARDPFESSISRRLSEIGSTAIASVS